MAHQKLKGVLLRTKQIFEEVIGDHFITDFNLETATYLDMKEFELWALLIRPHFRTTKIEEFWSKFHMLRVDDERMTQFEKIVGSIMHTICIANLNDRTIQFHSQCVLRKMMDKIVVCVHEGNTIKTPIKPTESTSTTLHSAHRHFLGYMLRQLSKKYGYGNFVNFYLDRANFQNISDESFEPSLSWTKALDRGGLVYCSTAFYNFFQKFLPIEDEFLKEKTLGNTKPLQKMLQSNKLLIAEWCTLWEGKESIKIQVFEESVRLHVNGRLRAFVRYVKDMYKAKARVTRAVSAQKMKRKPVPASKKPLRTQLANLNSSEIGLGNSL